MIEFDKKRWRQTYISNGNDTGWMCSKCNAVLKLESRIKPKIDYQSVTARCSNPKCHSEYALIGKVKYMSGENAVSKQFYNIDDLRLYPTHFQPVLNLFALPDEINEDLDQLIKLSFNHFWYDFDACMNKIRQALELIISGRNSTGKTLHKKILSLKEEFGEELSDSLLALKWIGNEGSHPGQGFNRDQVLDTYEIFVEVIKLLYPDFVEEKRKKLFIAEAIKNKGIKAK